MQSAKELQRRLIAANKEIAKLHRFLDVVLMKIRDLEKRIIKIDEVKSVNQ